MAQRPENVGILAMEVYFPTSYVRQDELEDFDGASKGKYTIGLGQESLAFCTDVEDVISLSLTVVKSLLEKYEISPEAIGRLEVGSETVIDKSKSIKTNLMELFEESGNADIEGVDSTNACYGGTAALLNCINWVESSAWDGRLGIVVAADIAVYAEGPARPTGGAGAVAMLIGPNAPLVLEPKFKATHMSHAYDFYKPDLASEYPVVDGKLTQSCFLRALDLCYRRLGAKFEKAEGRPFSLADVDYFVSHAPYNKLVQKSYSRLVYSDFLRDPSLVGEEAAQALEPFAKLSHEQSLGDRNLEKAAAQVAKKGYEVRVTPATSLPKRVGNMYCASLYAGLASLLYSKADSLVGSRVLMFSYGSGLASSAFTLRISEGQDRFSLAAFVKALDITSKIETTFKVPAGKFESAMKVAETRYGAKDFVPIGSHETLRPGTFYLTKVDDLFRRFYARKPTSAGTTANGAELANGFK